MKRFYASSALERDKPIRALIWDYIAPEENAGWRIKDEPSAALVLKEMNGYYAATGKPVKGFGDLKANGPTPCGAWIYSGVYAAMAEEPDGHPRRESQRRRLGSPGLGFRLAGQPPDHVQLRRGRPAGQPLAQGGPDSVNPSRLVRGRWVGLDVPDFPLTKPPTATAKPDSLGLDFHDGASPFIMKADGKGWLFAPSRLVDGLLPAHYEPYESPVPNLVYPARSSNPAAKVYNVPGNPYAPVGSAEYPCVLSTYRLIPSPENSRAPVPWIVSIGQDRLGVRITPGA